MSIKSLILDYLTGKDYVFGGKIDDHIRSLLGSKASNVSRRCRELVESGKLYRKLVQIEGKGAYVVQYKRVEQPQAPLKPVSVDQMRLI